MRTVAMRRYTAALEVDEYDGIKRLTDDRWSDAIVSWNALSRDEQKDARSVCVTDGHWWVTTPIENEVCRRCLEYRPSSAL